MLGFVHLGRRSSKPARSAHRRPGGCIGKRRMAIAASSAATGDGRAAGYLLVGILGILLFSALSVRAAKSGCEVLAELGPGLVVAADAVVQVVVWQRLRV